MTNETITIDLNDKDACDLIEIYIIDNFSDASLQLYRELVKGTNNNVDKIYKIAGQVMLNEKINIVLAEKIK